MTLQAEILSRPDCAAALAARDCGALAAILSAGRTKLVERDIGYGTVMDTLGATAGAAFLDSLTELAATQQQLDMLASEGVIPVEVAEALKNLAVVPDEITATQVQTALEGL